MTMAVPIRKKMTASGRVRMRILSGFSRSTLTGCLSTLRQPERWLRCRSSFLLISTCSRANFPISPGLRSTEYGFSPFSTPHNPGLFGGVPPTGRDVLGGEEVDPARATGGDSVFFSLSMPLPWSFFGSIPLKESLMPISSLRRHRADQDHEHDAPEGDHQVDDQVEEYRL
ncbi:MAG: hypothetical protein A4E39_00466 [Methanoregulaceae archaeon PtaB.Bin152]|nr:MAG: hypothetical protein A4E39_00466 [Methanoregulaceae archaeon PtaB.Bin152]